MRSRFTDPSSPQPIGSLRAWSPILAACALLTLYSVLQRGTAPELELSFYDKLEHFAVYALLATLVLRALPARIEGSSRWLLAFALASAFGLSDEMLQHFNPSRTGDPLDWLADSLGALFAVVAYTAFRPYRRLVDWSPLSRVKATPPETRS